VHDKVLRERYYEMTYVGKFINKKEENVGLHATAVERVLIEEK